MFKIPSSPSAPTLHPERLVRSPIRPIADNWEWQQSAACTNMPSDTFFFPEGERGEPRRNREAIAKSICARCPVIAECRDFAIRAQEPYGIWGGLSEEDRLSMRAKVMPLIQLTPIEIRGTDLWLNKISG